MDKSRREFFGAAGRVLLLIPAGWTLFNAGCSEESECSNADKLASTSMGITVTSSCGGGHTHDFSITTTDLMTPPAAGVSGSTTPYEDDGHVHTVELSQAELMQIQSGTPVSKVSGSTGGHTHTFNFRTA